MADIKRPTLDANGMVTGYTDFTIVNNTAYGNRHAGGRILAADFYPYQIGYNVTWLEPT